MSEHSKINLQRLVYAHYEHADFEKFIEFAEAFGLTKASVEEDRIYYQGYGRDPITYIASRSKPGEKPRFQGPGFLAKTKADFENACKVEGAVVHDISRRPGGGQMVGIRDPNGFQVEILWGVQDKPVIAAEAKSSHINGQTPYNGSLEKKRIGTFKRLKKGPAMVHKLGHTGFMTDNFEPTCQWYTSLFNFSLVDVLLHPTNDELVLGNFYRLDLGEEYVDHHTLIITRNPSESSHAHHSSFEVEDIDTQLLGHEWLQARNYDLLWGVGRHIHGSQVFDYWRDPSDYVVEHYADGDLVNCDTPVSYGKMGQDGAIWGPGVPDFRPRAGLDKEQIANGG